MMLNHFKQLDRLLRGDATSTSALRFGSMILPVDKIVVAALLLAALHGLFIATFTLANGSEALLQRTIASIIKVPTLFFLTLLVTFPSLYIFNAVVGSRLTMGDILRLLVASLGVMITILVSLGPIVAFFSVSTTNYPFILLFNVVVFAVAGILGIRFLMRTLERMTRAYEQTKQEEQSVAGPEAIAVDELEDVFKPTYGVGGQGALDRSDEPTDPKVRVLFRIWIVVFGLVGAQMGWVLRPFVGDPAVGSFQWLSPRESSFFEAVIAIFFRLF